MAKRKKKNKKKKATGNVAKATQIEVYGPHQMYGPWQEKVSVAKRVGRWWQRRAESINTYSERLKQRKEERLQAVESLKEVDAAASEMADALRRANVKLDLQEMSKELRELAKEV